MYILWLKIDTSMCMQSFQSSRSSEGEKKQRRTSISTHASWAGPSAKMNRMSLFSYASWRQWQSRVKLKGDTLALWIYRGWLVAPTGWCKGPSGSIWCTRPVFGCSSRIICLYPFVPFHPSIPAPSVSSRRASLASQDGTARRGVGTLGARGKAWRETNPSGARTILELGLPPPFLQSPHASIPPVRPLLPTPGRFLTGISLRQQFSVASAGIPRLTSLPLSLISSSVILPRVRVLLARTHRSMSSWCKPLVPGSDLFVLLWFCYGFNWAQCMGRWLLLFPARLGSGGAPVGAAALSVYVPMWGFCDVDRSTLEVDVVGPAVDLVIFAHGFCSWWR